MARKKKKYEDDDDARLKKKKKKASRRDEDDDDDDDDTPEKPRARNNIFTGLTLFTFVALAAAGTFFYLLFEERSTGDKLAEPELTMSPLITKGAPARPAPPAAPPVAPPAAPPAGMP